MEKQKTYPVLCGGTFFLLVLDAVKDRTGVRERSEGGSDGLSEPNVLVGLYKIINPEVSERISSNISSFVSCYKYCKQNTTPKINFQDDDVIEAFNHRVTEKYSSALKHTEEFVARFLCTNRESKKIEPGELKTIKGEKYLPPGTGMPFYLSYCNGKFYGA